MTLGWGVIWFLWAGRRSPFKLRQALRRLDPWQAGLMVHRWGWENVGPLMRKDRGTPGGWALGVMILYPLLVLAMGLLLQAIG